ncbi:5'-nucleotidase [Longibacter salinarum]|uniref:5'-nucleotidase n=1 Tax=Longibacter salinarum TaxID=1850348 RepID=A0A2A8D1M0_9BACT|nr:HAD family acid phosphatase [Longibacter salinarum]PEN14859.1 5'-nucleotidase [Longibacter salinarum]
MSRSLVAVILAASVFLFTSCGTSGATYTHTEADQMNASIDSLQTAADLRNPNLNSTLWQQTAVEYEGLTLGMYQLARLMLDRGLTDSTWTASLEQSRQGASVYRTLPPAVVLDVDETVLDNSAYQARLIRDNDTYNSSSWKAWCREEKADPVPGALAFTKAAAARGVQVIYLTNRDSDVEAATRENLRALGFPLDPDEDVILTQGEMPEWTSSNKTPRREAVAEAYRIVLLIGDNFGDFAGDVDVSLSERQEMAEQYQAYWGTRWITLPNPQYGSWEGATFGFDYSLPPLQKLRNKHDALRPKR